MVNCIFIFFDIKNNREKNNWSSQEDLQLVNHLAWTFDSQQNHNHYNKENFATSSFFPWRFLWSQCLCSFDICKDTPLILISKKNIWIVFAGLKIFGQEKKKKRMSILPFLQPKRTTLIYWQFSVLFLALADSAVTMWK